AVTGPAPAASASRGATTTGPSSAPPTPADRLQQPVTVVKGIAGGLQARLVKLGAHTDRAPAPLFPPPHGADGVVGLVAHLNSGRWLRPLCSRSPANRHPTPS